MIGCTHHTSTQLSNTFGQPYLIDTVAIMLLWVMQIYGWHHFCSLMSSNPVASWRHSSTDLPASEI